MANSNTNFTRLPRELSSKIHLIKDATNAYKICLDLEQQLEREDEEEAGDYVQRLLVHCRILGYLFHYAPGGNQALKTIVSDILSCNGKRQELLSLGRFYYDHFLLPFRSDKCSTPQSSRSSPGSPDVLSDTMKKLTNMTAQDHKATKQTALIRDRHRCAVTGIYDYESMLKHQDIRDEINAGHFRVGWTQCTHLIGDLTLVSLGIQPNRDEYAFEVSSVLKSFGYEHLAYELNGTQIHRLENVVTLNCAMHKMFDTMDLWLVGTEEPHKYKLDACYPEALYHLPEYVEFTTPNEERFPLPSPEYLGMHAASCKIAHLSGAAEYIWKYHEDLEDLEVLSADGSSALLLNDALYQSLHKRNPLTH